MVAVVVLLMTQVLPVFDRVFAQLGVRMGAVATGMMNAGAVLAKAGTGLAVVLVLIAAAALVVALAPPLRERFAAFDGTSPKDLARELVTRDLKDATDDRTALVIRVDRRG